MSVITCLSHCKITLAFLWYIGPAPWKSLLWVKCWPGSGRGEFSSLNLTGSHHYSTHPSSHLPTTIVLGLVIINFSSVNPFVALKSVSTIGEETCPLPPCRSSVSKSCTWSKAYCIL